MIIDSSDEYANAFASIRVNREFDSNVIDKSDLQNKKHDEQRISTLDGIKIDGSDEYENASDSIRANREFDSNMIDENSFKVAKLFEPRISTLPGTIID
jgi:hypothetical protein